MKKKLTEKVRKMFLVFAFALMLGTTVGTVSTFSMPLTVYADEAGKLSSPSAGRINGEETDSDIGVKGEGELDMGKLDVFKELINGFTNKVYLLILGILTPLVIVVEAILGVQMIIAMGEERQITPKKKQMITVLGIYIAILLLSAIVPVIYREVRGVVTNNMDIGSLRTLVACIRL